MSRLTLSRRQLLISLGLAAAASTPVFRRGLVSSAMAMDPIPQRFLGIYHPAGWQIVPRTHWFYEKHKEVCDARFFPGKRRGEDYTLSSITDAWPEETAPLKQVQEHLVFIDGLHNYANRGANNHMAGVHTMLTGSDPINSFQACGGQSLDYFLASHNQTQFSGINLSVSVSADVSNSGAAQRISSEFDPHKAYEKYFVALIQDGDTEARLEKLRKRRLMRGSVLDHLSGELNAVKPWVPRHDRPRLEAHQEAIREMERRLDALPKAGGMCVVPSAPTVDPKNNETIPLVVDAMFDLLVAAFACHIAHTGTFAFGRGTLAFTPTFLNINEHYHALSHYWLLDDAKQKDYLSLLSWTSSKVAQLIRKLDAIPEADGKSLLHHALMVWSTDNSTGWAHRVDDVPFILAGQASGALQTGRVVSYPHGTKHNRLLLSIANAFGHNIQSFGPAQYSAGGPLDRLFSTS